MGLLMSGEETHSCSSSSRRREREREKGKVRPSTIKEEERQQRLSNDRPLPEPKILHANRGANDPCLCKDWIEFLPSGNHEF